MSFDPKKQTPTQQLMIGIASRNMPEVRAALAAGADPTESLEGEFCTNWDVRSNAYAELIHRIWYGSMTVGVVTDIELLREILDTKRTPIPEKYCPWAPQTESEKWEDFTERRSFSQATDLVDDKRRELKNLAKAVEGYRFIKNFAATEPASKLLRAGKLIYAEDMDRPNGWEILFCGREILQGSPSLFRELIEDRSVWASSADAANYAQAMAEITTRNRKIPLQHLPWTNRMLDEDQRKSLLGTYARDESPVPGGKR